MQQNSVWSCIIIGFLGLDLDPLEGSNPRTLTRFQENLIAFVVLLVAAGVLFLFVGLAQRCQAKKRRAMYLEIEDKAENN